MSRRLLVLSAGVAALLVMGSASADTAYHAPFKQGPVAETWNPDPAAYAGAPQAFFSDAQKDKANNHVKTDPATGEVTVLRVNPVPGALNCGGSGAFGFLRVDAVGPASSVTVKYTNLALDSYTWLETLVRDAAGNVLAPESLHRGPDATTAGTMTVPLAEPVKAGDPFTVDIGLKTASACPNADGGTVTFTEVAVG